MNDTETLEIHIDNSQNPEKEDPTERAVNRAVDNYEPHPVFGA